ncbi:hypothetical protein PanWU01x14_155520 [Parasponia andersonii]|uniref:Secreted protein n=1 Tax=Parasponia andersonii TaxID=3476 RepID=A0A2P5CG91_PARAD|nr:hypothetical protein PanWU01x14_155520 [Parasponia andersonii]
MTVYLCFVQMHLLGVLYLSSVLSALQSPSFSSSDTSSSDVFFTYLTYFPTIYTLKITVMFTNSCNTVGGFSLSRLSRLKMSTILVRLGATIISHKQLCDD